MHIHKILVITCGERILVPIGFWHRTLAMFWMSITYNYTIYNIVIPAVFSFVFLAWSIQESTTVSNVVRGMAPFFRTTKWNSLMSNAFPDRKKKENLFNNTVGFICYSTILNSYINIQMPNTSCLYDGRLIRVRHCLHFASARVHSGFWQDPCCSSVYSFLCCVVFLCFV
jgi:hypothetical protein